MEIDNNEVPVLFRWDEHACLGNVVAVFPTIPHDRVGHLMTCYAHVGQHSVCDMGWLRTTRAATIPEFATLKHELEQLGYRMRRVVRISRTMHETRRKEARR